MNLSQMFCECGCGQIVNKRSRFIRGHWSKGKRNSNYKGGITSKQYYCKDCGIEIYFSTALYGKGFCSSCAIKGKRNFHYGKKFTEQHKENLSKAKLGTHQTEEHRDNIRKALIGKNVGKPSPFKGISNGKNVPCDNCGKLIYQYPHLLRDYKYHFCQQQCRMEFMIGDKASMYGVHNTGEKASNWQGGLSFEPYPITFNNQLKDRIRVRDNFICQLCGVPELECDRRLSIHHIDYVKENCDERNLITLCCGCNAKVNFNREHWTNFFKEKINEFCTNGK